MKPNILIIGSGEFGIAMSQVLIDNKQNVFMTTTNSQTSSNIMDRDYIWFDEFKITPPITCFTDYFLAFKQRIDVILLCVPSSAIHSVFDQIKPFLHPRIIIINAAKGLNPENLTTWSDLFVINGQKMPYALLVGPSFASEILAKNKTIVNIVTPDKALANKITQFFDNHYFKLVYFDDEYVASLVSSFKNALAVGLGLLSSFTKSINTQSAYLIIGLNEIQKILEVLTQSSKVKILNFFGVGDIYLTCTSDESRNFQFGYSIGQIGIDQTFTKMKSKTIEGFQTIRIIHDFIVKNNISSVLFETLYKICYENQDPKAFIDKIWDKYK